MGPLPDIQSQSINGSFILSRVGITKVKKPVIVQRGNRAVTLVPTIDLFVDLPKDQKGSHMSRNVDVIEEAVDESVRDPAPSLEDLCMRISNQLLERHEYATRAEANMVADYFLERAAPGGKKCLEVFKLIARSISYNNGHTRREIGVKVTGMTTCPCGMETTRSILDYREEGPFITHNQRNIGTLMVEVPPGQKVEADDLIDIVEASMSSPTIGALKRRAEGELIIQAHGNPRFVEDVVREMLSRLLETYPDMPDGANVLARSVSEESIHKHNAFAERISTFGRLRGVTTFPDNECECVFGVNGIRD